MAFSKIIFVGEVVSSFEIANFVMVSFPGLGQEVARFQKILTDPIPSNLGILCHDNLLFVNQSTDLPTRSHKCFCQGRFQY